MQLQIQLNFLSFCNHYAQWFRQSALGLLHSLTVKITTISFLSLIAFSSDANWTDFSQPNQSAINYFIEFQPGIYNQPIDTNIEKLLSDIKHLSTHQINIVGISQSASSLATYDLALLRAKTIKKQLVRQGIYADRIIVSGEDENFVMPDEILHGVFVTSSENMLETEALLKTNPAEQNKAAFIEFPAGVYDNPMPNQLNRTIQSLLSLPQDQTLRLVGISQSKTNLATQPLALQRAQTVADQLIAAGFKATRIKLDSEVTNNVQDMYLTHGVHIFVTSNKTKDTQHEPLDTVLERLNSSNTNTIATNQNKETHKQSPQQDKQDPTANHNKSCTQLNIQTGSLKKNIQREIADCGYLIGEWSFGTEEEYIDWIIPVAYKTNVEKGIFGILNSLEKNYQIRAHVHQLDRSIDFLPSIQYEKGQ
jgi:outer membrane protein OmpA-like peptidoglycan-associated protein